jgi:putative selenium metabolism hydrolase
MDEMRDRIVAMARRQKSKAADFLRRLIAIPSESRSENGVALAVRKEMLKLGYPFSDIDRFGNVVGRIGTGRTKIIFDAHIDTRGIGDRSSWRFDPYAGDMKAGKVYGHGAANNKGGLAAIIYAGSMIKELDLTGDTTVYIVGSVQAELCEGLAYKALFDVEKLVPDYVILSMPTGMRLCRGHRGRIEFEITLRGQPVHSSDPSKGFNCIYGISKIVQEIEALNSKLPSDKFLGKASVAVTHIDCDYNGPTALPESCRIIVDRRLVPSENEKKALAQIKSACQGTRAKIEIVEYDKPSYRGLRLPMKKSFPTWALPEKHPLLEAGQNAYRSVFKKKEIIDKWTTSTAGSYTYGVFDVPTIGFGPSEEAFSGPTNDHCRIDDLEKSMAFYASLVGYLPDSESLATTKRKR